MHYGRTLHCRATICTANGPIRATKPLSCAGFCHCRVVFLCRCLIEPFPCGPLYHVFHVFFATVKSLSCIFLIVHGKAFFVVWGLTTKNSCTAVPVFPVVLAPRLRCHGSATFRAHRQCCAILPSPSSNPHVCCLSRRPVGLHLTLPSSGPSTSLHNAPSRLSVTSGLHLTSPWIMVQVACTPHRPARIPIAPLYLGELMYFARSNLESKIGWETL
jgi:hypothetical protein